MPGRLFSGSRKRLGFGSSAEYLNQAVGDQLFLSVFQLPDRKTEAVRVAPRALAVGVTVPGGSIRTPPTQAARSGAHAANSERPSVGQLLHNLLTADVELGAVNLPAVTRRYVAQGLGIKLPGQRRDPEFLYGVGDNLRPLVVGAKRGFVVLIDEDLKRLEHAKNRLLANFAATPDAIFLRAHVQQRVAHQVFPADENSGRLRAADILSAAEGDHIEAERGIFPESRDGRHVRGGVVESVQIVLFRNGDGLRSAHFAF